MQNLRATTSLKPGVRDVFIAKRISQMNNGHHRQKWNSPILGVERIVLRDVFFASIFLAYVEPNFFICFRAGKFSSAAPTKVQGRVKPIFRKRDPMTGNRHRNNSFFDKARDTTRPMQRHHIRTNRLRVPLQKERPIPYPYHNGWELNQLPR
jgi:hypothetical protein